MKAIKKPIPIEVERFDSNLPMPRIRERAKVQTRPGAGNYQVWNEKHFSWIGFEHGDYLNVTNVDDIYPIAKDVFEATYDVVNNELPAAG